VPIVRPRCCAAQQGDELPPSHSITSSARSSDASGIVSQRDAIQQAATRPRGRWQLSALTLLVHLHARERII
jgi:hypothetical protein